MRLHGEYQYVRDHFSTRRRDLELNIRELPVVAICALNHSRRCFNICRTYLNKQVSYYVKLTSTTLRLLGRQAHAATDGIVPAPVLSSKWGTRHCVGSGIGSDARSNLIKALMHWHLTSSWSEASVFISTSYQNVIESPSVWQCQLTGTRLKSAPRTRRWFMVN